jgi:hypothetical protein
MLSVHLSAPPSPPLLPLLLPELLPELLPLLLPELLPELLPLLLPELLPLVLPELLVLPVVPLGDELLHAGAATREALAAKRTAPASESFVKFIMSTSSLSGARVVAPGSLPTWRERGFKWSGIGTL